MKKSKIMNPCYKKVIYYKNSDYTLNSSLTIGKEYEILDQSFYSYTIIDDNLNLSHFSKNIFLSIKEFRKIKLKKILNNE